MRLNINELLEMICLNVGLKRYNSSGVDMLVTFEFYNFIVLILEDSIFAVFLWVHVLPGQTYKCTNQVVTILPRVLSLHMATIWLQLRHASSPMI